MKHAIRHILSALVILAAILSGAGCDYVLNERTFFKTMTNMLAFPSSYMGSDIELDCFVYELTDVESGKEYTLGVRKCSSGVGCTCGNDTIIGFILDYDGAIPPPAIRARTRTTRRGSTLRGSSKATHPRPSPSPPIRTASPTAARNTSGCSALPSAL